MDCKNSDYMNPEKLLNTINENGIENVMFVAAMRPLRQIGVGPVNINYTSSSDELIDVPCMISEDRYKLEDNYKITLKPIYEGVASEHFYISDLCNLIRQGSVSMYVKKA